MEFKNSIEPKRACGGVEKINKVDSVIHSTYYHVKYVLIAKIC